MISELCVHQSDEQVWVHLKAFGEIHARNLAKASGADKPREAFISAIRNGTPVMVDAEIGHRTRPMGHLGHIAIQRERRLEWNSDTERFTNDDEANKPLASAYHDPWKL